MKISLYTAVKDGIVNDFHVEAMLKHHLPLADEIIVNEGYSKDDTYDRIRTIDSKIKVFRSNWGTPKGIDWWARFKDVARQKCSGEWCILLDCDEFIPEWEFPLIRAHLETTSEILIPVKLINFYGNYKVFHSNPDKVSWPSHKVIIHRNLPDMEVWGDGSNVRYKNNEFKIESSSIMFNVHHFGMVRDASALRHKWWIQGRAFSGRLTRLIPPRAFFRIFPHNWNDSQFFDDLTIYDGPHIQAVRQNPQEFIRDDMKLLKLLELHLAQKTRSL